MNSKSTLLSARISSYKAKCKKMLLRIKHRDRWKNCPFNWDTRYNNFQVQFSTICACKIAICPRQKSTFCGKYRDHTITIETFRRASFSATSRHYASAKPS